MTREKQSTKQGSRTGKRDQGSRTAVTGGAQMDGFVDLVNGLLVEGGVREPQVFTNRHIELPGYFRAEKQWDLLVVADDTLLAAAEFKSHVGSFGNNYNNRAEEAIGNATDLRAAYRAGAFRNSPKPWLGYLMLLEDAAQSRSRVKVREPHFEVLDEFQGASYARRYEILLTKLVREQLYDSACLLLSDRTAGLASGQYSEPNLELAFNNLATSIVARGIAHARMNQ